MTSLIFPVDESKISPFLTVIVFVGRLKKNVLAGVHKKFERAQHTEIYLLGLKVQYKPKFKLPLDMIRRKSTIGIIILLHEYKDLFIDMDVRNNRSELAIANRHQER